MEVSGYPYAPVALSLVEWFTRRILKGARRALEPVRTFLEEKNLLNDHYFLGLYSYTEYWTLSINIFFSSVITHMEIKLYIVLYVL